MSRRSTQWGEMALVLLTRPIRHGTTLGTVCLGIGRGGGGGTGGEGPYVDPLVWVGVFLGFRDRPTENGLGVGVEVDSPFARRPDEDSSLGTAVGVRGPPRSWTRGRDGG